MSVREAFDHRAAVLAARREATRERVRALLKRARTTTVAESSPAHQLVEEASAIVESTMRDLDAAQEEMAVQNEALFEAQFEMSEAGRHFKRFFDMAPACFLVTDADGKILEANEATAALLHRPRNYLLGKSMAVFVAAADRSAFRTALGRTRLSAAAEEWPVCIAPTRHLPTEVVASVRTLRDHQGRIESLYWVLREDTARASGDLL